MAGDDRGGKTKRRRLRSGGNEQGQVINTYGTEPILGGVSLPKRSELSDLANHGLSDTRFFTRVSVETILRAFERLNPFRGFTGTQPLKGPRHICQDASQRLKTLGVIAIETSQEWRFSGLRSRRGWRFVWWVAWFSAVCLRRFCGGTGGESSAPHPRGDNAGALALAGAGCPAPGDHALSSGVAQPGDRTAAWLWTADEAVESKGRVN